MPMHDMNDSMPMVGDRIKIVPGHEHVEGHDVGTVRQVIGGALGIEFDDMKGMIHQWYVASEVIVTGDMAAEEPKEPGDDMEMRRDGAHPVAALSAADRIAAFRSKGIPMGKMRQFRRAIRNSVGKPLLFHARDGYGAVLRGLFERVARGDRVHDAEIHEVMADTRSEADVGDEPRRITVAAGPTLIPGGAGGKITALVPVRGIAMYDLDFSPYCFSTLLLAQTMAALANDPEVGTIVLDIDSPGGMVTGTAEAADAIYAAGKRKKVVALINPLAASAAYWLASQASEIVAIKSADVGSIGVFMVHTDCSKFNEMQGMKITYIYAGEHKVEGNSDEPLADEARAYFQSEVDTIYRDFLKAVARGRGKSVDEVFENFGKGRCMMAPMAKKVGMIDDFMTIDAALSRWGVATMPATRGRRGEDEAPAPTAGKDPLPEPKSGSDAVETAVFRMSVEGTESIDAAAAAVERLAEAQALAASVEVDESVFAVSPEDAVAVETKSFPSEEIAQPTVGGEAESVDRLGIQAAAAARSRRLALLRAGA